MQQELFWRLVWFYKCSRFLYSRVISFQIKIDIASYQLDYLRFCSKFHRMCINVLEYGAQNLTMQYSQYSIFDGILKTSRVTSFECRTSTPPDKSPPDNSPRTTTTPDKFPSYFA